MTIGVGLDDCHHVASGGENLTKLGEIMCECRQVYGGDGRKEPRRCSAREAYADGHLPGAVYVHLDRDLSGPKTGTNGRHPLPTAQQMRERLIRVPDRISEGDVGHPGIEPAPTVGDGPGHDLGQVLRELPQRLGIEEWMKQTTRPGESRG